jgi:glycosyltransferase involved in cell wall biosynthesis
VGGLRIAIILGDINPDDLGGAEIHLVEVMKRLLTYGHELHVLVGADTRIKRLFPPDNIFFYPIRYPRLPNLKGVAYTFWATGQLLQYARYQHFDILHAKQEYPHGVVGATVSKRLNIPLYTTVQNPLAYKEELVFSGPKVLSGLRQLIKPLVKYALRNSAVVAAVSNYSLANCQKLGAKKCVLIPNGVDTQKFYPKAKESPSENPHIVTTSTLIPRNGLDTLIKGFKLLLENVPNASLTIAGEGPLEKELKSLAQELGIESKVKFIATLPHEKVPELLWSADLFVRPSIYEGFGMSFIEAMASGVPVVACPVGGVVDFITHRQTGMLVPPNDPEALKGAMLSLLHNRKLYRRIRTKALELVRDRYSWDSIAAKVNEVYHTLVRPRENGEG